MVKIVYYKRRPRAARYKLASAKFFSKINFFTQKIIQQTECQTLIAERIC